MKVKVASVQTNPQLGDLFCNMGKTLEYIDVASAAGAELVVFPECSLTGYCFSDRQEALASALIVGEEWTATLIDAARRTHSHVVVGFVEAGDGNLYNSLLVVGPSGIAGRYRKSHLPGLGVDNFVTPGSEPYSVIETPMGKLGGLICYDIRFPEAARILALQGADLLVHITNLPITASTTVEYLLPARAIENQIFVLSSGRVGEERGFRFLGRSEIIGVKGEILAQANEKDETVLYAELDLALARQKHVVLPPGPGKPVTHVRSVFDSRRPELYSPLTWSTENWTGRRSFPKR
ncbi:MAG: carbon-nitrogen hydrolase family protein [Peptococcaceae bacterium]|nr:carbon-nitrogen hydrolase family protein [Peptococcaceae bacterium]